METDPKKNPDSVVWHLNKLAAAKCVIDLLESVRLIAEEVHSAPVEAFQGEGLHMLVGKMIVMTQINTTDLSKAYGMKSEDIVKAVKYWAQTVEASEKAAAAVDKMMNPEPEAAQKAREAADALFASLRRIPPGGSSKH